MEVGWLIDIWKTSILSDKGLFMSVIICYQACSPMSDLCHELYFLACKVTVFSGIGST